MKYWFCFLAAFWSASVLADTAPSVSETKAEAIIRSLPEFIELAGQYKEDVDIDGPFLYTPLPAERAALGESAWHIDVFIIVHDDKDMAHGSRWAFFRVNASSGEVWVDDFDFESGEFVLRSLDEWRKHRKPPNQALLPTSTAVTPAASHLSRQP